MPAYRPAATGGTTCLIRTVMLRIALGAVLLACVPVPCRAAPANPTVKPAQPETHGIAWEPWSEAAFARAATEHRLVLLHLGAVWCHWCHVMEAVTYHDPEVVAYLGKHYVTIYVDQDSRPDISRKYEDYGWPATILFDAKGHELAKRAGYIEPGPMLAMLKAFVADPTPGPSAVDAPAAQPAATATVDPALHAAVLADYLSVYDHEGGGWGHGHKYLDADAVELAMAQAQRGDKENPGAAEMAKHTLDANLSLIDPVWGGVYQYSVDDRWDQPHFEKIMSFQGDDMRIYAQAYSQWGDARYLQAAHDIQRYLQAFFTSPEGAFYTSQDADVVRGQHSGDYFKLDDAGRRARGLPAVDRHIYTRENGWAIRGLCALYAATGDRATLDEAIRAARWVIAHRGIPSVSAAGESGSGFSHDEHDVAGPYLGDTLAMGQAFLALYEVTADRQWLARSRGAARFIALRFPGEAGIPTSASGNETQGGAGGGAFAPTSELDENTAAARWANLLYQYTGNKEDRQLAERAMRYLASAQVARRRHANAGLLLAERELGSDPMHITIVGAKGDAKAGELFRAALRVPAGYRRIEWWDPKEGALPRADTDYPTLQEAAAFLCAGGRCSSPIFDAGRIAGVAATFGAR